MSKLTLLAAPHWSIITTLQFQGLLCIQWFKPKRHGLFGQLNTWGGWNPPILGKRSLNPPQFHSRPTNSVSYKSWGIQLKFDTLLRLLRLKLRPQEAAEVARFQAKKIDQKFWNPQFLSYTNVIHLKRKLRKIIIYIWNKFRRFCYEKIEKTRLKMNFNPWPRAKAIKALIFK